QIHIRLRAVGEDQDFLVRHTERGEQRHDAARMRRVVVERVDHLDRALSGPRVERALPRQRTHLPRHVLRVAPRRRTEHRTTTHPMRGTRRSLPRPPRPLLLPRLLIATRHILPDLRRRVPLPLIGAERLDRLVHHRKVDRAVEQLARKRHRRTRRAQRRKRLRFERHGGRTGPRRLSISHAILYCCLRTTTSPFFGPATEPRR